MQHFSTVHYDLVLLDVTLPDRKGFELCAAMKEMRDIPIIMVTARDMLLDKIQGFHSGADDYIVKPFEPMEVIARIHARLKKLRSEQADGGGTLEIGNVTVNMDAYEVKKNGESVPLKPKEMQLLFFLLQNRNIVLSRETLLQRVWNYDYAGDTRTVDVHIKNLREKLIDENDAFSIRTIWGVGYKLEVDE
jgi:DNA-binding response OmpR family regulator